MWRAEQVAGVADDDHSKRVGLEAVEHARQERGRHHLVDHEAREKETEHVRRVRDVQHEVLAGGEEAGERHDERRLGDGVRHGVHEELRDGLALAEGALEGGGDGELDKDVQHARLRARLHAG